MRLEYRTSFQLAVRGTRIACFSRAKLLLIVLMHFCVIQTPSVVACSSGSGEATDSVLRATDETVLEVLVEGFRICASGLQPEVDKCMRKVLGPDWLEKCKLPKQHIWPGGAVDGEGELIDLEGLLHLVVSAFQMRCGSDSA